MPISPSGPNLRVALAGLGFMGAVHLQAWPHVSGAELACVVSANPQKLAGDLSQTGGNLSSAPALFDFSHLKRHTSLAQALDDPDIDAVDLCLPTHLHSEACMAALRAGKHVLLEKPLARTSPEAYALVAEASRAGKILMAGHVLRFFPEWRNLARALHSSPLKLASFRRNCARPAWSAWLRDSSLSGGAPLDLLIHDADFVLHCFGTPEHVSAVGLCSPELGIDWLSAHSSFRNSNAAVITGGWHASPAHPFSMEFSAIAAEGSLEYSSLTAPPPARDPWIAQLQHFTDSALSHSEPALCPPAESARAVRFVELMMASRSHNGEVLPWTD